MVAPREYPEELGERVVRMAVELEREVKELRWSSAILRGASAFFAAELDRPSR